MRIWLPLFPNLTQLDPIGPFEVFANTLGITVHLLWKTRGPVPIKTTHDRLMPDLESEMPKR